MSTAPSTTSWRVTGLRRWLPVVLAACFLAQLVRSVVELGEPRANTFGATFAVAVVGVWAVLLVLAAALTVVTWRTAVSLTPTGVEVRRLRRRFVAYGQITRAYRDRLTSGAITLFLADGGSLRLPAPVAGLATPSKTVDDALEQIRARLPYS